MMLMEEEASVSGPMTSPTKDTIAARVERVTERITKLQDRQSVVNTEKTEKDATENIQKTGEEGEREIVLKEPETTIIATAESINYTAAATAATTTTTTRATEITTVATTVTTKEDRQHVYQI